ncbi:hypothetical protein LIER_24237 [Lithospermum erythrorhizon]|uniref:DNA-(apurinic or apyrimidinic site) endonuclease 2 n=1 Tax=Lithospermum erythrorhizon TaxID=34254 RepID=A0AAV3R0G8_LITER
MLNQMISTGVATFCRVKSAYESNEVALPVYAEEGFTGQLCNFTQNESKTNTSLSTEEDFEGFSRDELLKVDSEGRCMITDHEHFVLFNVYGPRADCDDAERVQFKRTFYNIMQRRWESLLRQRRRILVVGDLNIAPAAIDRCDAGPDFENNEFRKWFRSLLRENGGIFLDVFRRKHPERKYAYTCWSTSSGAEVFNFGSRIDHILSSDSCLHEEKGHACHNFLTCHVEDCDILVQFKRWKSENGTRWKEGRSIKMEGSDHAPVFVDLVNMPSVSKHNTPSLSSRFYPHIYGNQQTLVSMLMRRKSTAPVKQGSDSINDGNFSTRMGGQPGERPSCSLSSPNRKSDDSVSVVDEFPQGLNNVAPDNVICSSESNRSEAASSVHTRKKAKHSQGSQLSLKLFFQSNFKSASTGFSTSLGINHMSDECSSCSESVSTSQDESFNVEDLVEKCSSSQKDDDHDSQKSSLINDKANFAVTEWRRIQQVMQSSIPLCKGHNEPCIVRVVKKAGPSFGQRFYVCNRAEGPASNLEANCGYFKWASSSKSKKKG